MVEEDGCLTFHIPTTLAEKIFNTELTERQIKRVEHSSAEVLQHSSVLWPKCGDYNVNTKKHEKGWYTVL